ncbi:MAG TPA: hypothetical protein VLD57_05110 [Blastocatellia bacterium]|nr:hypothetical protein [Blastocatellia bacterium]
MSDDTKRIRILAVDDHPLLRQGVASLIADEPDMMLGMNGSYRKGEAGIPIGDLQPAESPEFCQPRERCFESRHFWKNQRAKRESTHPAIWLEAEVFTL